MSTKRIIVIALIFALLAVIGVQRVQMAQGRPSSPGIFVVRDHGEWVYAREFVSDEGGTFRFIGDYRIVSRRNQPLTVFVHFIDPGTRVAVDIDEIPTATRTGR